MKRWLLWAFVVAAGASAVGCDREASVLFNLQGEREVFVDLCCECLVNTDPRPLFPDAGALADGGLDDDEEEAIAIINEDREEYPDDTCYVPYIGGVPANKEWCIDDMDNDGLFVWGVCVEEDAPCYEYCHDVLAYSEDR